MFFFLEFPSWTYSHEETQSFSSYDVLKSHGSNFNVSLVLRTIKPDGLLFQLRRPIEEEEEEEKWAVYFSVYIEMGRVFVSSLPNSTPLSAPGFVCTGQRQFIQVEVQHGKVIFEHGGLRYGIGEITAVTVDSGDRAYVGGLPGNMDSDAWGGNYKGCLQDLRLDSVHLVVDSWEGFDETDVYLSSDVLNITQGCVSDDTCKVK